MDPKSIRAPGKHAVKTQFSDGRNYTIKLQVFWQAFKRYKTALEVYQKWSQNAQHEPNFVPRTW